MGCIKTLETSEKFSDGATRLGTIVKKSFDHSVVKAMTGGRLSEFERFYESVFPHLDFEYSRLPNVKEMNKLDKAMNQYLGALDKKPMTMIGRLFNLPENILKRNPITNKFFRNLVEASNYYHGNLQTIGSDMAQIKFALNRAMGNVGFMQKWGFGRNEVQKELKRHQTEFERLEAEGQYEQAQAYKEQYLDNVDPRSQMAVNNALYDLMLDPSLIKKQDITAAKLKYGPELVEAVNLWHYGNPNKGIKPLKDRLWKVLGNGILDYIKVLEGHSTELNDVGFRIKNIEKLYNDYFAKGAPKKPKDYFPTQVLDIAPTFAKFSEDIYSGKYDADFGNVSKYLDAMISNVSDNLKVSSFAFEKKSDRFDAQNKDVIGLLDTFQSNVIRFNYNARATKETTNALKELMNLEKNLANN